MSLKRNIYVLVWFVSTLLFGFDLFGLEKITATDLFSSKTIVREFRGGKDTVVVFLSAKCPCSRSHVTEIKSIANEYPQFDYIAVHANLDEDLLETREYFKSADLGFPVLQDTKQSLANSLRASKTPHAFLISSTGSLLYSGGVTSSQEFKGSADRLYLREALKDLSEGKEIRTKEARTLGCAIRRRRI